jgi:hypothetical protein
MWRLLMYHPGMRNLALVLLVVVAACGKKSDSESSSSGGGGGKVASCNSESMHSCREYRDGNLALGTESIEKLCTVVDKAAKFSNTACPAGAIGSCKMNEGKDYFYEGYPLADKMEEGCKSMGGTFAK